MNSMIRRVATLGDIVDVLSGFAFKSEQFGDTGDLPLVRIRDVKRGYSDTFYTGSFDDRYVVVNGDLLVGMDGEFNRERWSGGRALLNQRVCKIRTNVKKLDCAYLYHFLPKALKEIEDRTPFATVKHLSSKDIKGIQIPLPPLDEQRRIAAILDKADALRRKRKRALELLDAARNAAAEQYFRVANIKLQIGEAVRFITSGGRNWSRFYSSSGSRFVRSFDVQSNRISDEDPIYVQPPDNAEARRTRTEAGDVLLTITGSRIGRVAEISDSLVGSYVSQHVAIIRIDNKIIASSFLSRFLNSINGQRQIEKWQYGQTKPGLNFDQIKKFEVPYLSIDQQIDFEKIMLRFDELEMWQQASSSETGTFFASLQHRAFTGQL